MTSISIVIATYNSSKILPRVLAAIRNQKIDQKTVEILVVDGGSTDRTRAIAEKFSCKVINNPHVEPLYAKYLGFLHSKGKYLLYIDHDEVLKNPDSLLTRLSVFRENKRVHALTGSGYYSPPGYQIINSYINEFGDPFSFFIYRLSKHADFFIHSMKHRYRTVKDTGQYTIFEIPMNMPNPIIELVAGGGMVDKQYVIRHFPEVSRSQYLLPHLFHVLRKKSPYIALVKQDPIIHYSSDTLNSYIRKLIWRIKNNIFFTSTTGSSGYSGRDLNDLSSTIKKFLFIPYAASLVCPIVDAVYLSITRKNLAYCMHVPLTIMTVALIGYFYVLKIAGIKPILKNYDGTVNAYEIIQK